MNLKEMNFIGNQEARFVLGNIDDAHTGAWIPAKPELLHEVLRPYVKNVRGVPSIPARLVNRVNNALNSSTKK